MKKKKNYAPPLVLKESRIYTDTVILAGSIVNKTGVIIEATEQKVENYDFGDPTKDFDHNWE